MVRGGELLDPLDLLAMAPERPSSRAAGDR